MHLTILAEATCPNAPILQDRLAAVLDGRADVSVSRRVICDEDGAARWGMRGSPTLLIDGVDPFAELGQPPSLSCRLYRDDDGRTSGAPSAGQLRQAIEQAAAMAGPPDPAWLDSVLRVHELLRHPRSRLGVGSLPPGHHRRYPQPSPRPANRHRHLRPATPLTCPDEPSC
jgi:hypothetical protein